MIFDVYYPITTKQGKVVPGVTPHPMEWAVIKRQILSSADVKNKIEKHRAGVPDVKITLPSICFVGSCIKTRAKRYMKPTQLVMIDIDHCKDVDQSWRELHAELSVDPAWMEKNVMIAHVTPSRGLHIFFKSQGGATLEENMKILNDRFDFQRFGDYDSVVHDFSRLSFAFPVEELLYESTLLYLNSEPDLGNDMKNPDLEDDSDTGKDSNADVKETKKPSEKPKVPVLSDEEQQQFDKAEWRGVSLKTIIDRWLEVRGEPGENEIHNYYNEMVKYFRNIMGNNRKLIFHLLPRFGHTADECWSQINSICRVNTLSTIDKPFYFFLKDNGFYRSNSPSKLDEYLLSEKPQEDWGDMPTPPPVFREFLKSAPEDFRIPTINALLPILGTLTSYLEAVYPFDDRIHTTSFFSIIYGPPSSGKGFVGRLEFLFDDLKLRDLVQSTRENIYLRIVQRKGANDKAPALPHTSLRIIPPKNSESEFLSKQADNHGYHMYTYAAEMDSWAKGEKAAGGNKSDMIRIAWDNGEYGQQYKSANTFKGMVKLYWNVLITGTQAQVESYFSNVENGLVTRCSFCKIENQEFQTAAKWKPIPKKGMEVIRNFMKRCDNNSYVEPCCINPSELLLIDDDEFDNKVDWHFQFKPKQTVDISWIMPTIEEFHAEQCKKASLDLDQARDVFRRRVGVRGFRMALLCTALYPKINARSIETIRHFVAWWMRVDLSNMLTLWGKKYNEAAQVEPQLYNRDAFHKLNDEFTDSDLLVVLKRFNVKSPVRTVIYLWKKAGYIDRVSKGVYRKKIKNDSHE